MKQWVKKLLSQFDPSISEKTEDATVPSSKEISEERATLLYIIDIYNRHLFEIEKWPLRKVREILDEFGKQLISNENPNNEKLLFRLRQFFSTYRIDEYSYVQNTFDDFKGIIWDFADQLGEDMRFEQDKDLEVKNSLSSLREAVESESIEDLRAKSREFIDFYVSYQTQKDVRRSERMNSIQKNLSTMKQRLEEAQDASMKDHMTGAFNRKAYDAKIAQVAATAVGPGGSPACLILLDIDHFKKVNDQYGHDTGDFVIKELVKMLKTKFSGDHAQVSRIGGEEFAVILESTPLGTAQAQCEAMLKIVREHKIMFGAHAFNFTISIGLSHQLKGETVEDWVKRTDIALYESKHNGRDRVSLAYDPNNFGHGAA